MLPLSKALGVSSCPQPGCDSIISAEIRCLPLSCPRITACPKQEAGDWTQPPVTLITLSGATSRALSPLAQPSQGLCLLRQQEDDPTAVFSLFCFPTILSSETTLSLRFTALHQAQHKASANPPSPAPQVQTCWERGSLCSAGAFLLC